MAEVTVIGGGLAGCEAAWQLAEAGFSVRLLEMKPVQYTPAHHYEGLAELVCSNSLKADRLNSAAGLLKAEMTRLGSLLMRCARKSAVAAGGALAATEIYTLSLHDTLPICSIDSESPQHHAGNGCGHGNSGYAHGGCHRTSHRGGTGGGY